MNFIFKQTIIDYDFYNTKSQNCIIFLHGWGGNKFSFSSTVNLMKCRYNILTITMPTIQETITPWQLNDYKNLILEIIKIHNIKNIYIICHSFGFRVACLLKEEVKIKKMVVTGGAGLKKITSIERIKNQNNIILLKQKRFKYFYKKIASRDYINLPNTTKQTFKNIVNLNTQNLIKFSCPILIFWGKLDKETKPWIAKLIHKKNDSILHFVDGDHFAYLTCNAKFNNLINKFFNLH